MQAVLKLKPVSVASQKCVTRPHTHWYTSTVRQNIQVIAHTSGSATHNYAHTNFVTTSANISWQSKGVGARAVGCACPTAAAGICWGGCYGHCPWQPPPHVGVTWSDAGGGYYWYCWQCCCWRPLHHPFRATGFPCHERRRWLRRGVSPEHGVRTEGEGGWGLRHGASAGAGELS
eukprot:633611-Pelagomonas_calceolata.AAC.4